MPASTGSCYITLGKVYRILGSDMIQGFTLLCAYLSKIGRSEAGDLLKLARKMGHAAVFQLKRNFR